jgi:hypothetical protein
MMSGITITRRFQMGRWRGNHRRGDGELAAHSPGHVPRISRLMALAIRFDQLICDGVVADQAELARLGHLSRARLTQIMDLLNLAPDIQEQLLIQTSLRIAYDTVSERLLRPVAAEPSWRKQRQLWDHLRSKC